MEDVNVAVARFASAVDVGGPAECWEYAKVRVRLMGKWMIQTNRLAYMVATGRWDLGYEHWVKATCRNLKCCNLGHLRLVRVRRRKAIPKVRRGGRPARILGPWFWEKVDVRGEDECWPWKGKLSEDPLHAYGRTRANGRIMIPSRAAWELTNGPIPPGLNVCHKCDNPPCCNPKHLFLGTDRQNHLDSILKGRQGKLKPHQIDEIRARYRPNKGCEHDGSGRALAEEFGVSRKQIYRIVHGKRYNDLAPVGERTQ